MAHPSACTPVRLSWRVALCWAHLMGAAGYKPGMSTLNSRLAGCNLQEPQGKPNLPPPRKWRPLPSAAAMRRQLALQTSGRPSSKTPPGRTCWCVAGPAPPQRDAGPPFDSGSRLSTGPAAGGRLLRALYPSLTVRSAGERATVPPQVKTVLPPSNFTRAVRGSFSGAEREPCDGGPGAEVTNAASAVKAGTGFAGAPATGAAAVWDEVVLATATSLRLVALAPPESATAGVSARPEGMLVGDADEWAATDEGGLECCRTLCEQPVFGTILCLATLRRPSLTVGLLRNLGIFVS